MLKKGNFLSTNLLLMKAFSIKKQFTPKSLCQKLLEDDLHSVHKRLSFMKDVPIDSFAYRVGLRAQANFSAPTFEPAHEARTGQHAALSV